MRKLAIVLTTGALVGLGLLSMPGGKAQVADPCANPTTVPANDSGATGNNPNAHADIVTVSGLAASTTYNVTASGTWTNRVGGPNEGPIDADFSSNPTVGGGTFYDMPDNIYPDELLNLVIGVGAGSLTDTHSGATTGAVTGGTNDPFGNAFNAGHSYTAPVTTSGDGTLQFAINDNFYDDNLGGLSVTICPQQAPQSGKTAEGSGKLQAPPNGRRGSHGIGPCNYSDDGNAANDSCTVNYKILGITCTFTGGTISDPPLAMNVTGAAYSCTNNSSGAAAGTGTADLHLVDNSDTTCPAHRGRFWVTNASPNTALNIAQGQSCLVNGEIHVTV